MQQIGDTAYSKSTHVPTTQKYFNAFVFCMILILSGFTVYSFYQLQMHQLFQQHTGAYSGSKLVSQCLKGQVVKEVYFLFETWLLNSNSIYENHFIF